MVVKIIDDEIESGTATSLNGYESRDIALSAEQALAFAKYIAARLLKEIQICGSRQTLSGLSVNLNRTRAILHVEEMRSEQNDSRFHG